SVGARAEEAQTLLGREGISQPIAELIEPIQERDGVLLEMTSLPPPPGKQSFHLRVESLQRVAGDISEITREVRALLERGDQVRVYCTTKAERERFEQILDDQKLAGVICSTAPLSRGFSLPDLRCSILTNREMFHRYRERREPRRLPAGRPVDAFWDLKPGDWVVHLTKGIGRFLQIIRMKKRGKWQEFLVIEYRDGAKLYVPAARIDLVQKYIGAKGLRPKLSPLGGRAWEKRKAEVTAAVEDFASELLEVQAIRGAQEGIRYPEDDEWQREFESSFPFPDTPDQAQTIIAIKEDMTRLRPMDRLICGDVGYGKTELAIRAAFKAATAGYQVAVLVPTTVLAEQHFHTFTERMADYPIHVEVLSRFRKRSQQKAILERMARGEVEILIGTHRILSKDVIFRNLGMVIIDEEQRFGVRHKEILKQLRRTVDVLTLTATPIPRTLHMALLGIRDISSLSTPPRDRLSIQTRVTRFDEHLIREAILLEKARGGQVFFVHNRVQSIDRMAARLRRLIPEATFDIVHGQMNESLLEKRMVRFVAGEIDVLVTTTIIESGLDLPNVNTMIINMADRFGLADLHQLRGRVGRYRNRAFAYMLLPERGTILPPAEKRLRAIEEFSELGAGFQIAMRDLEIRGAGNILGPQQSGHIASVGYDLYCRLLRQAVARRREQPVIEPPEVDILLDLDAFIPEEYIPHAGVRFQVYRKFASAASRSDLDEIRDELRDRFGEPPEAVVGLFVLVRLRLGAGARSITGLIRQDEGLEIRHRDPAGLDSLNTVLPFRLARLDERTSLIPYSELGLGTSEAVRALVLAFEQDR
ncbi:MAG: transcription-repair coupling factor, partial [Planctomycetota bacterium]|nr:transcription-repair coupling factor [Planctomycetota bacterium]